MIASIPSPHSGIVNLGPLHVHLYGLTLLVAILACVWLTTRRWKALGGDPDLVVRVAVWGVAFGVVGARAYHDITSWSEVPTPKWKGIFEVWQGGLGVWGGILLGTLAGWVVVRRSGNPFAPFMDAAAPGLLLAQGIGRIGNWWNQELFGKPTSLPWGLKIDIAHRPSQYISDATFHPTFLYELIWDVIGVLLLLWVAR
ncbi:MAG: prolipoprotein diacylglyceryl transferase, partial [Actinobacteria bacterium]|nr:prolipoprotein diacylglyceryl transferase [Actinomycetota bacterium]